MKTTFEKWALPLTRELTFIQLREGTVIGNQRYTVPAGGIYVPIITEDLAHRIQTKNADEVVEIPLLLKGILFLLAIDSDFRYKNQYIELASAFESETKAVAYESSKNYSTNNDLKRAALIMKGLAFVFYDEHHAEIMYASLLANLGLHSDENAETVNNLIHEAKAILESRYLSYPTHAPLLKSLTQIYVYHKQYKKAEDVANQLKKQKLTDAEHNEMHSLFKQIESYASYEKGYYAVLNDKADEGLNHLLPLVRDYPDWWNLHFFIGLAFKTKHNYEEALFHFNRVVEIKGFHLETHTETADIYMEMELFNQACRCLEEILKHDPDHTETCCQLVLSKAASGKITEARQLLQEMEKNGVDPKLLKPLKMHLQSNGC